MWILVTRYAGGQMYLNFDHVSLIVPTSVGCEITLSGGQEIVISDDFRALTQIIDARHAQRRTR